MLVKSMKTLAQVRGNEPLTAAYRAGLRARTFETASLHRPTVPVEVIPVTTADGARLRVHAYGPADGDVIVLIHGWSCCIEYWNPQINAFADRYRVIAYDQRGHGESTLGRTGPSTDTLADDLCAVLDATIALGKRAVLVGHSMGGITLQAWASRYPEQVTQRAAAVILANTAANDIKFGSDVLPVLNKALTVAHHPVTVLGTDVRIPTVVAETVLTAPVPLPGGRLVRTIFQSRVMAKAATRDEVDFSLAIVRSCRPLTRGLHAAALMDVDLGDAAKYLTVPTTVIAGTDDHLLPERLSHPIVEALTRAGHLADYQIWRTGHLSNVEAEDRFNTLLADIADQANHRTAAVG